MSKIISFQINGLPDSINKMRSKRQHWTARSKYHKQWYDIVHLASIRLKPVAPWERVKLSIHVYRHSMYHRDYDGLVGSLKPVVDGLIKVGHIKDDSYEVTGPWEVRQFHDPKDKQGRMIISIEPRDD